MECPQCKGKGTIRQKVGFSYRPKLDYVFALRIEYEDKPCPNCRCPVEDQQDEGEMEQGPWPPEEEGEK